MQLKKNQGWSEDIKFFFSNEVNELGFEWGFEHVLQLTNKKSHDLATVAK